MSFALLIATSFSIGFFIESVIGIGGGLVAYFILGFFIDLKEMVIAGLYIGTLSSLYIVYTDPKSLDKKLFSSITPLALIGTILGAFIFSQFSNKVLSLFLGSLLILLAIKTVFFATFTFPKIFRNKLIFIGGISHGAFGIGGPFIVNAIKNDFSNKSSLRTTMAVFFVSFNLIRVMQLKLQNQLHLGFFTEIWWTILPVFIMIYIGYRVHLKISEDFLKKMVGLITILAGINFIFKAL